MLLPLLVAQILVTPGPVNTVSVDGAALITSVRRDLLPAGPVIVADADAKRITDAAKFWSLFRQTRFHDYAQISTRVPIAPQPIKRTVKGGDQFSGIEVIGTPGPTAASVSYLFTRQGKRHIFTGDLIYKDGKLLDVYSLQDAIPETKTRGYHGFAARAGQFIESLRKIKAAKPDVLIPSRGPFITDPAKDIDTLIARLQKLLQSHFATDALRWYWGEESWQTRGRLAMTKLPENPMEMSAQRDLPEWIIPIGNSRLVISTTGAAFLMDAGYPQILEKLDELKAQGRFRNLEGIWVTHYHDDHTDHVAKVAKRYDAKVYFNDSIKDIVEHPANYRMPCLTTNPITGESMRKEQSWQWREFKLTSLFFPGQTLYHGGLALDREDGSKILFVGDSFTPSGTDDYCLQNRNLVHANQGYRYCLDVIEQLGGDYWLINQHVLPMFKFDDARIDRMRTELTVRERILADLTILPDANYAVDEGWARFYPYSVKAAKTQTATIELRLENHTSERQTMRVKWNVPRGWRLEKSQTMADIAPRSQAVLTATLRAIDPDEVAVLTADIQFAGYDLRAFTEAILERE
jgi:glyoxylase-like metal-dependent hydrolase (beta-lactamase superfamily II)